MTRTTETSSLPRLPDRIREVAEETFSRVLHRGRWAAEPGRHAARAGETPRVPMDERIALRRAEVESAERRFRRSRTLSGALGAMLAAVSLVAVLAGPLFAVRDLEILGAEAAGLDTDEIRRLAAVTEGSNLLLVDVHAVSAGVATLPLVAGVDVQRRLPGTVSVRVVPRVAAAVTPVPGGVAIIDPEGIVLDVRSDASGLTLPTVAGESQQPLRPGERWDDPLARRTVKALTELPSERLPRLTGASFDGGALVFTFESGLRAVFGLPEDVARKGRVLAQILADLAVRGQAVEYVDVSSAVAPTIKPAEAVPNA